MLCSIVLMKGSDFNESDGLDKGEIRWENTTKVAHKNKQRIRVFFI